MKLPYFYAVLLSQILFSSAESFASFENSCDPNRILSCQARALDKNQGMWAEAAAMVPDIEATNDSLVLAKQESAITSENLSSLGSEKISVSKELEAMAAPEPASPAIFPEFASLEEIFFLPSHEAKWIEQNPGNREKKLNTRLIEASADFSQLNQKLEKITNEIQSLSAKYTALTKKKFRLEWEAQHAGAECLYMGDGMMCSPP